MGDALSIIGGIVVAWFVFGCIRKFRYYSRVEKGIRFYGGDPIQLQRMLGSTQYRLMLKSCQDKGHVPETAALLILNYTSDTQ